MKRTELHYLLLFVLLLWNAVRCFSADIKWAKEITFSDTISHDTYLMGSSINVYTKINGDLIAAGGTVSINDSVKGDLMVTGGTILIHGPVGDDIRVMGGTINITKNVSGDVVVLGGNVQIGKEVIIMGDLIIFAGNVIMDGLVKGKMQAKGGNISLNGNVENGAELKCEELSINGEIRNGSSLAATKIHLGSNAKIYGNVAYWQEAKEFNFGKVLIDGKAIYNPELKPIEQKWDWKYLGFGIAAFFVLYFLSALLCLILLNYFFAGYFEKTAETMNRFFMKSFGIGILYFIAIPILSLFLFITIIGIPVGLFLTFLFILSILFGNSITAIITANWIKNKYQKNWGKGMLIIMSALCFITLKLVSWVPFIGWLVSVVMISAAFGAILQNLKKSDTKTSQS